MAYELREVQVDVPWTAFNNTCALNVSLGVCLRYVPGLAEGPDAVTMKYSAVSGAPSEIRDDFLRLQPSRARSRPLNGGVSLVMPLRLGVGDVGV